MSQRLSKPRQSGRYLEGLANAGSQQEANGITTDLATLLMDIHQMRGFFVGKDIYADWFGELFNDIIVKGGKPIRINSDQQDEDLIAADIQSMAEMKRQQDESRGTDFDFTLDEASYLKGVRATFHGRPLFLRTHPPSRLLATLTQGSPWTDPIPI